MTNHIILGIDPGYDRLGIAVINKGQGRESLLFSDCLTSTKTKVFSERLGELGMGINKIIKEYNPTLVVIEKLFVSNNQKTAMMVGEVRGMIMYLSATFGIEVIEYTPLEIKTTITGYGKADKNQMTAMVKNLITITKPIRYDDEFDAIAIALTASARATFK